MPILEAMGMRDAVDPDKADFSGITGGPACSSRKVIHQANIDVDETGTEAAAATAVVGDTTGGCGSPFALKHEAQLRPPVHVPDPRHEDRGDPVHGSRDRTVEALTPRGDSATYFGRASQAFQAGSARPAVTSSP